MKRVQKCLGCLFILLMGLTAQANTTTFIKHVDAFLKENVQRGFVQYQLIKENPQKLNDLLAQIAKTDFVNLQEAEQKSFLINAYNILVIKNVIDAYPLESPLHIKGFFDVKTFNVGGQQVTLNQLEKDILYQKFPDARLHFALVCAAIGCPKLSSNAYKPAILDKQLDMQSRKTLNNPKFIKVQADKILISEIFKWYEQDFVTSNSTLIDFLNQFRAKPLDANKPIDYYPYNWQLNAIQKF